MIKKIVIGLTIIFLVLGGLYFYSLSKIEIRSINFNKLQDINSSDIRGNVEVHNGGIIPVGIDRITYDIILEADGSQLAQGYIQGTTISPGSTTNYPISSKITWIPSEELAKNLIARENTYARVSGTVNHKISFQTIIDVGQYIKQFKEELRIITDDDYSRKLILDALDRVKDDEHINISEYISSIETLQLTDIQEKCLPENRSGVILGCINYIYSPKDGKLIDSKIYLSKWSSFAGLCGTFEHTLYHEFGHAIYTYRYGGKDKEDEIYKKSLEFYADNFADKYASFDESKKQGCDKKFISDYNNMMNEVNNKREIYEEKGNTLRYALDTLSKWDKYSKIIPSDKYEEYLYDYNHYKKAYDEYTNAANDYENARRKLIEYITI